MSKTMRAIMCREPWDYRLEEVPMPEAGPGEVVIKVNACGVCASDIKCYTGAPLSGVMNIESRMWRHLLLLDTNLLERLFSSARVRARSMASNLVILPSPNR